MSSKIKKILLITGGAIVLLITAATALVLFVDVNAYKPRIEAAASDAIKMDVKINGRIRILLFPDFVVSADRILVKNRSTDLVSIEKIKVGLELRPLLRREVRVREFGIIRPALNIELDKTGKYNFETPEKKKPKEEPPSGLLQMDRFYVVKGDLVYSDNKTGERTEMKDIDMNITDFELSRGQGSDLIKNLRFSGDFKCKKAKTKNYSVSNIAFPVEGKNGVFTLDPLTMDLFGGSEKGTVTIDITGATPVYKIRYTASRFRFEKFMESFSSRKVMKGEMDFSLDIASSGKKADEIKKRMTGEVLLKGDGLTLYNYNLDSILSKFEQSQSFSLVDAGAFLLAGPLGTALTKGYDFAGVYAEGKGGEEGYIQKIYSRWKVKNGAADAEDVALATKQHRIALKGRIDFMKERYDNITLALLNDRGCSKFTQNINGPFRNPQVEKVSALRSLVNPLLSLFGKAKQAVAPDRCEVFYAGSVKHPKQQAAQ